MGGKRWLMLAIALASCCRVQAQDADSLLTVPNDSILSYSDSLSIFYLIDSLIALEESSGSQLAVRMAYNSNVLSAGRTLGIDQFGLSPGVSFYHTSGLFADVSSYWSKDFNPKYYLTTLSLGYMHTFSSKFSVMGSYDRFIYNLEDDYTPFTNGLTVSPYLDLKPFLIQVDYSYYFGDGYANRLMPSVAVNLTRRKLFGIDKISFMPAFYLLFGDQTFTNIIIPSTRAEWIRAYIRMQQGLPWYQTETYREFGIMNYSISVPLNIQHKNFSFLVSYVYSIPKSLPSETLTLPETGFLAASVTYYIPLKRKIMEW